MWCKNHPSDDWEATFIWTARGWKAGSALYFFTKWNVGAIGAQLLFDASKVKHQPGERNVMKQASLRVLFYYISAWGCAPVHSWLWQEWIGIEFRKNYERQWIFFPKFVRDNVPCCGRIELRKREPQVPFREQDKRCEATSSKMSPKGRCKIRSQTILHILYGRCNERVLIGSRCFENLVGLIKQALWSLINRKFSKERRPFSAKFDADSITICCI